MSAPVPIVIRGVSYPSKAAAARALGITVQAVHDAAMRGRIDNAGLGRNWWHKKSPQQGDYNEAA